MKRSGLNCCCNSGSSLGDAVGSLEKELIRLWNSILHEPGQPGAQARTPHRMQEECHDRINKLLVGHTDYFISPQNHRLWNIQQNSYVAKT